MQTEGIAHFKISEDPSEIETGTSRLVAQFLSQLRTLRSKQEANQSINHAY
jgi:hypothetical protein